MKAFTFKATIVSDIEEPNIDKICQRMRDGTVDIDYTEIYTGAEPVIYVTEKEENGKPTA